MDVILAEVLRNALLTITREMKATIIRTAHSSTVQEAQDFSVGLFEGTRLVAQAEGIAAHLGALPDCIASIFERFPPDKLQGGDVIIVNDPFAGGSHLPDVTMVKPVRVGSLLFMAVVRAHWSDMGGMAPGSITGKAISIYQEGLRLPPIKLLEAGRLVQGVYDLILQNVRLADERAGDIRAQLAACNLAEDRLRSLVEQFGEPAVADAIEDILNVTERRTRAAIARIPPGEYCYEDYLDSDGIRPEPIRIRAKIRVDGGDITVDFAGTAPQSLGPVNATRGVAASAILIALKSILDPEWPCNEGFFRPLRIANIAGTCADAQPPAPTGSCWEVCARIVDVVIGALARALPELVAASGCGSVNHTFIGGRSARSGRPFVWYEYPTGGRGATATANGCSAVARITGGATRDLSVERAEREFPLLCTRYELRADSGGPGRRRGGLGLVKEMRVLDADATQPLGFSCLWDRVKSSPYGLNLGMPGARQQVRVRRASGDYWDARPDLGAKETMVPMMPGDTLVMKTSGGGGYGDPLAADAPDVAEDVRAGYLTPKMAEAVYGVSLASSGMPDSVQTEKLRDRLRRARRTLRVTATDSQSHGLVCVHPRIAEALGLEPGELVEMAPETGPSLRAWVAVDDSVASDALRLAVDAVPLLGVTVGERVWLRPADVGKLVEQGAAACLASE